MSSLPSTTKAVVVKEPGVAVVKSVPVPTLRPEYMIVKTRAVAINPTDWKHVAFKILAHAGIRVGCDYVGEVVQIGSKVTKQFKVGDRVAGFAHGSNQNYKEDGAFAEYITVKGDLQIKVPEGIPDEEAATWGVTISTVAQGLYQTLDLPLPSTVTPSSTPAGTIFIYGGSTATGIGGISFAKASNYTVITTSSPMNFPYLKSLGADHVLDYHSPTLAADVRALTSNKLTRAWDCISEGASVEICAEALSSTEPDCRLALLLAVDPEKVREKNPNVSKVVTTLAYTTLGEHFVKWADFPAVPEDFEYGKMFWEKEALPLLAQGRLKFAKPIVNQGGKGLEGTIQGMQDLKEGKVRAGKLVYTL